jgi:hypothetical protein
MTEGLRQSLSARGVMSSLAQHGDELERLIGRLRAR